MNVAINEHSEGKRQQLCRRMGPVSELKIFTGLLGKGKSCNKSFLLFNSANAAP